MDGFGPNQCFERLVQGSTAAPPMESVAAWWRTHREAAPLGTTPVLHAIVAGFVADRIGFAFASGYEAALRQLLGDAKPRPRALCATESGGAHPRAIRTTIVPAGDGHRLEGTKTFVTLGEHAEELIIVAREPPGAADERPRLRCVRIPATRQGVRIEALGASAFVPEIPHAAVTLAGVRVEPGELVGDDGYADVLKPFRTIEDIHVFAALLGHVVRLRRLAGCDAASIERALALVSATLPLAAADPLDPGTHRVLGGLIDLARAEVDSLTGAPEWSALPQPVRDRFVRDRRITEVAGKVRARRLATARERCSA